MRLLPPVARLVSSNPEAYIYLAESIRAWPRQEELAAVINRNGWAEAGWQNLTFGIVALHSAVPSLGAGRSPRLEDWRRGLCRGRIPEGRIAAKTDRTRRRRAPGACDEVAVIVSNEVAHQERGGRHEYAADGPAQPVDRPAVGTADK